MQGGRYRQYVLWMATAVYMLNLVDRGLMALLLQPIKVDLHLTDTQLGSLTGIVFGVFYALVGIPIARWADRGDRVSITSLAIGLWGLTVMSSLWVTTYAQLVLNRIAAAVGESGCKPPTYSLVGDYFPQAAERTRAMSVYWMGSPLAVILSLMLGGRLNDLVGWRMTFFLMGIPGLILAVVVKATVREPRLQRQSNAAEPSAPPVRAVLRLMWTRASVRHLGIALVLVYALSYGLSPWEAAFLSRNHGMGTTEVGFWLGLILSVGGIGGLLAGGYVANRWFAGNERGQTNVSAVAIAAVVPCFVAFLTVPGKYECLAAFVPIAVAFICFFGPIFALMQRLVPERMRATMLAVIMLVANLIGMGLGPQIVGILSDWLRPALGIDSLRYAMLTLSLLGIWAAYHFRAAGRTVESDLAAAAEDSVSYSGPAELHDRLPESALSR